jgi:hypothetical protein
MNYIVYKITNLVNGKIYVGCHKTKNIDDDYMGSGKLIKRAIDKYGIDSFTKVILAVFDNPEAMFNMESELVDDEFILREDTYNLKRGGYGGFDHINGNGLNTSSEKNRIGGLALQEKVLKNPELGQGRIKTQSARFKKLHAEGKFKYDNFKGKTHTPEARQKISEAVSKHQKGKGNSQYGTCWIHNLTLKESKRIKKEDLNDWTSNGWIKGRKMKF